MTIGPNYWMWETSGILKPAVMAYLKNDPLTDDQIAALRAYLRQWIEHEGWMGPLVDELRSKIDGLVSRDAIDQWLRVAVMESIDPL